jgi:hypothetical protein
VNVGFPLSTIGSPDSYVPVKVTASAFVLEASISKLSGKKTWIAGMIYSSGLPALVAPGRTLLRVNSNL